MEEENNGSNKPKESVGQKAQQTAQNVRDTVKKVKDIKKKAQHVKNMKNAAHASKFLTALGPALPYIGIALLVILIIIFLIGIIVFILTMPGMVMENLKAFFHDIGNKVAAFFGQDTTQQIEDEEIYEILDYLEDMGYDLKGYGFLTTVMTEEDIEDASKQKLDNGVIRDTESGLIAKAESAFIFQYIMSDNYIYTVKNYNVMNGWSSSDGFWNKLWGGVVAIGQKIAGIFVDQGGLWGKGMIYLETQGGSEWTDQNRIKVDAASKNLIIKPVGSSNEFKYSLDGWTGRYGMPLEFLLSVHLATNMPDLAFDMVQFFGTEVLIKLKETTVTVESVYRDPYNSGTEISYEDLKSKCELFKTRRTEVIEMFKETGLTSPDTCTAVNHEGGASKCSIMLGKEQVETTDENEGVYCDSHGKRYTGNGQACEACIDYANEVMDALDDANITNKKSYLPYVSKVTDHWYRDVYFEADDLSKMNVISVDEEYEAFMKERWTLYETDDYGAEVLYIVDEQGNLTNTKFEGTKDDAVKQNVSVAKKAIYRDDLSGAWSVYEEKEASMSGEYEQTYPDDESIAKRSIYHRTTFSTSIEQKEEAIRVETNPKIKRIFLNNYYFKYDGSEETADVILALREVVGSSDKPHYGNLNGDSGKEEGSVTTLNNNLNKTVTMNKGDTSETETYMVKEYASKVDLTKDSLSSFSMLENTHTPDADYIYKDFKELIVELGYFEKEELAENIPEIFEWFIPEIGSYGYPTRSADKRENMYGTMAHSKGDYDAFNARDIQARYEEFKKEMADSPEAYVFQSEVPNNDGIQGITNMTNGINAFGQTTSAISFENGAQSNVTNIVGAIPSALKDPEDVSVEEFLEMAVQVHAIMEGTVWEYCAAGMHSGPYSRHTQHTTYRTVEDAQAGDKTADCSSYVSWVLQGVGLMDKKITTGSEAGGDGFYGQFKEYLLTKAEAGTLQPGDILLSDKHVQINGEDGVQFNAGSTGAIQKAPYAYTPDFYTHVIRLPFSGTQQGEVYEGFEGGEAVVSPATGILLEYGTYEGEDASISQPENGKFVEKGDRLNYDLKYPYSGITGLAASETVNEQGEPMVAESREVYDKVGYAKILVLDTENYLKLESSIGTGAFGGSLYNESTHNYRKDYIKNEDMIEDLSDKEKTLYAYKEFVERYESFDLGGYIIYIDGFKAELPNPERENAEEGEEIPLGSGIELSMDYFKSNASTYEESLYEKDEAFNYTNKDVKDRVDAEDKLKATAAPMYYDSGNDLLFIKEGTVIGRTFSDKEVVEDLRGETYVDVEELNENRAEGQEEIIPEVIGNYLRIVMRDLDDTVVENVEEYLKLDPPVKPADNDWVLFYWLPFESGAADTTDSYIPGRFTGPACVSSCSEGEVAIGIIQETSLTSDGMCNQRDNFIPFMKENYPEFYEKLAFLENKGADFYWSDYNGANTVQAALKQCDDMNHELFLTAQMEEAKEHYYYPLIENHPWVENLPTCVQAEILHLNVWGPATLSDLDSHKTDSPEELLAYVRHKIANTDTTMGEASGDETSGRAWNEPEIGYGILNGKLTEEEVEKWVRTNDTSILIENGIDYK